MRIFLVVLTCVAMLAAIVGCGEGTSTTSEAPVAITEMVTTTLAQTTTTTVKPTMTNPNDAAIRSLGLAISGLLKVSDSLSVGDYNAQESLDSVNEQRAAIAAVNAPQPNNDFTAVKMAATTMADTLISAAKCKLEFDNDRGNLDAFTDMMDYISAANNTLFAVEKEFNALMAVIGGGPIDFPDTTTTNNAQ